MNNARLTFKQRAPSGEVGSYLSADDGTPVSPITTLVSLLDWCRANGWTSAPGNPLQYVAPSN